MAARRPVSILIAALGGQGGGVLSEWIVGAAGHAGYPAQATSIPGVAQRTGATTYYLEVFPERGAEAASEPVFSLYPTPGDVDVIIASELLEAGRTIEADYASPGRTTLIASTHRLFSIAEKSAPGDGIFPPEALEQAARRLTRQFIGFDGLAAARQHQTEVNALLLGALAATGLLPMTAADFEAAIREGGVAVERNVRGLKAGAELVAAGEGRAGRRARRARGRLPGADEPCRGRVRGAAPRGARRGDRPADRLPGRGLRRAVPRSGATGAGARSRRAAHRDLRPTSRGVDDLRGRDPGGRSQDPGRALRAHPP
jgi:indolepyruvate ferredoxin oxidoreductase beta subunit